jgi:hypothetical protein
MSIERRVHERFELRAKVELLHGGKTDTLAAINISAGGILLINERNLECAVGEEIRIHFDVPELAPAFSLDATVIRVVGATTKAGALAAMWTSSDAAATAALAQMLWKLKS